MNIFDPKYPEDLVIGMTNLCTTHCRFCYRRELNLEPPFFPFERFKSLIDQLGPKLKLLEFSGIGEPLMHPQLKEFVLYARQKYPPSKLKLQIVTNGSLLSADLRRFLVKHRFEQVWISVNASTSKTYSRIMPGLDFEATIQGIRSLIEERNKSSIGKPSIFLTFVVTKINYMEAEDFIDLGLGMGADIVAVRSVDLSLNKKIYIQQHVSRVQFEPILDRIEARAKSDNRIDCAPRWSFWPADLPSPNQRGAKSIYCADAQHVFGIYSTDGKVTPCCYLAAHIENPENCLGNIYDESALKIWKHANSFRKSLGNVHTAPTICKQCTNFWGKKWYSHKYSLYLNKIIISVVTLLSNYPVFKNAIAMLRNLISIFRIKDK